jgi:hypothetical protein
VDSWAVSAGLVERAGSPSLITTMPPSTNAPPANCTHAGAWCSSSQAKTSAASTSPKAANDASREPSRRLAAIPEL